MELQSVFDGHTIPLITCVKQCINENKTKISPTHPKYKMIRRGASLLWQNYFRYADETDQTTEILEPLSSVVERLRQDLQRESDETLAIMAYGALFGLPLLKKEQKQKKKN